MRFSKLARTTVSQGIKFSNSRRLFSSSVVRGTTKNSQAQKLFLAGGVGLALAGYTMTTTPAHSEGKLDQIKDQLDYIEGMMTNWSGLFGRINEIRKKYPGNLMAKNFDPIYFQELSPNLKKRLLKIIKSGLENPDSAMGCYAMQPDDYDTFKFFLDKVIREYHKIDGEVHHKTNWEVDAASKNLDLTKLGLGTTSMRVRVGRNLESYPLPGAMTKEDRINLEKDMIKAFKTLIKDPAFGGNYYSLTPGTDYSIDDAFYKDLVKNHIMFKSMDNDPYLNSAGISSDWPYGRGCYVSADKGFIVWVGEEDHLRIMCMKKGTVLNEVFDRLRTACNVVEKNASKFAHSKDYGYVTSCPTNLGTGMRASVHIKVPNLTRDGTETKAKQVCKPLGLSVRGVGGEHTPIGADGTVDISPSARLCIEEQEIIKNLYKGIKLLLEEEKKAAKL